jgi:NitT/TauT family transport system substrate-binding protein
VHFIKVPASGTIAALESGDVDVAFLVEPYLSWAVESGHRVLSYPYVDYAANLSVAAYFTSTERAETEPELVTRFAAAIKKSLALAQNNPAQARDIFASYTTTVEETRASLFLPRYTAVIDSASLAKLGATAARHGILVVEPDLSSLLP